MKNKRIIKLSSLLVTVVILLCCMAPAVFAQNGDSSDAASTAQATQSDAASATASGAGWVQMAPMHEARLNFQTVIVDGNIYAIGGFSDNRTELSSVEEYNPDTNVWTTKASMSTARSCFQTEVVNGEIYAIGGENGDARLASVEKYNPTTDTWKTVSPMLEARTYFCTEVIDNKIYAIGGMTNKSVSIVSSVEEYDPVSDKWTTKAPMSTPRWDFKTEVINGTIYAFGGADNTTYTSSVEAYNPVNNTWMPKASMPTSKSGFQAVVIDGKIYSIGGVRCEALSSTEEYNPVTDIWTSKASMSVSRNAFRTVVFDGKIYSIGGCTNSFEEYDPVSNKWTTKASMSTSRHSFQSEIVNGTIYAIGGRGNKGTLSSVEAYTVNPSLTVTPSADKVKLNSQFTTTVAIHNGTNICAEDMKLTYDTNLFEYVGSESLTGLTVCTEDKATPGALRFVVASQGIENAATGDKDLIKLTFKAKAPGTGKVDITQGRIADNVSLETDVAEANCGEATVTVETSKDVNRSGEVTLLDLGIDAGYYGKKAADTDTAKYDTDAVPDGVIDGKDLDAITVDMLANAEYPMNK